MPNSVYNRRPQLRKTLHDWLPLVVLACVLFCVIHWNVTL